MLPKCVNPFCNRPLECLSQGKLFVVDFPKHAMDHLSHRTSGPEHFWLCQECAGTMTVAVRREYDTVSVKIINLPPDGATKLKFRPSREVVPEAHFAPVPPEHEFAFSLV
jgi:5-methylcytosine-specific restriction endonuclease McrA